MKNTVKMMAALAAAGGALGVVTAAQAGALGTAKSVVTGVLTPTPTVGNQTEMDQRDANILHNEQSNGTPYYVPSPAPSPSPSPSPSPDPAVGGGASDPGGSD